MGVAIELCEVRLFFGDEAAEETSSQLLSLGGSATVQMSESVSVSL